MTEVEKYKVILHLVSSGVEFAISVRGQDKFEQACNFFNELHGASDGETLSPSARRERHFLADESQLAAFQKFLSRM